jgi:ferredoxin-NADP reductase
MELERRHYRGQLVRKVLLSEREQCYHLEFLVPEVEVFGFEPGQFISLVAVDGNGKQQTRAYSIASAPRAGGFDLCLNRVEGGFFSNLLCDLEPGGEVEFHGPHGMFVLKQPLTDSIFVATGTGIAPFRGFVEWLFPENGEDRSEGRDIWLVYGTRYRTELYYEEYFEKVAAERKNFRYLKTLTREEEGWTGMRGRVQEHVARIVEERARGKGGVPVADGPAFDLHAYVCGLNEMVTETRNLLKGMGWNRKQIVFERYD